MKEYEQKICNIIDNLKAECEAEYERAYREGYATGYDHGKQDGYEEGQESLVNAYAIGKGEATLEDIKEAEYNRGLNEAWEAAKKIASMNTETSENITGYFGLFRIMENLTPIQAIKKIKEYEDKQEQNTELKIGDEVIVDDGVRAVIIGKSYGLYLAIASDFSLHEAKEYEKTGRHFDEVVKLSAELKG